MSERLRGQALLRALETGEVRVAERGADGQWRVNAWVKEEILQCFREAGLVRTVVGDPAHGQFSFVDKLGLGAQQWDVSDGVRIVPGGTAIRRGAHLGKGVIVMPPAYVNVGAFVDEGSMVDSHALIGSCAQIGKRVHVSAAAQIGGNCGVYEGVLVRRGAVLASGVVLSASTPVFDLVERRELRGTREQPLEIPERAVVVPGSRAVQREGSSDPWAAERGLSIACALIVKHRDERTDRATALEQALR